MTETKRNIHVHQNPLRLRQKFSPSFSISVKTKRSAFELAPLGKSSIYKDRSKRSESCSPENRCIGGKNLTGPN